MNQSTMCPKCETFAEVEALTKNEAIKVRSKAYSVISDLSRCLKCKEIFATEEQEDSNFKRAYDEYRKEYSLLLPHEIRALRGRYSLSQLEFGRFLGWGDVTINRYENGGIQDPAHNDTLLLLRNPKNASIILEANRHLLDTETTKRLEITIAKLVKDGFWEALNSDLITKLGSQPPSENNGFKRFDFDRFQNLVLTAATISKGSFKTAMNKILWYVDFSYYASSGVSITGTEFLKFKFGPVPDSYDYLFADLRARGVIDIEERTSFNYTGEIISARGTPKKELFSDRENKHIEEWARALAGLTASKIKDLSHKEEGYLKTTNNEPISYVHAKTLKLTPAKALKLSS